MRPQLTPTHSPPGSNIANLSGGDIGRGFQRYAIQSRSVLLTLVFLTVCWVLYQHGHNAMALLKIITGGLAIALVWMRGRRPGIPIVLVLSLQLVIVYALPIMSENEAIREASPAQISSAATEILVYGLMVAVGWSVGINRPDTRHHEAWNFRMIEGRDSSKVVRLSFTLLLGSITYESMLSAGALDWLFQALPTGVSSVTNMASKALTLGGGLLGGFTVSSGTMHVSQRVGFWILFWLQFALLISGFLLSSATGLMCATCLGCLIGRQRPPVRLIVALGLVCSFFNLTKFEMREAYWDPTTNVAQQSLNDLPDRFLEWSTRSYQAILFPEEHRREREKEGQQLSDRVNNLSILMFVDDAVQNRGFRLLGGETYSMVPKLLIPRLFWPNKPRAHAGQELLNVHFARQTLEQTFKTYIAWGLLAEAYGNFGPIWGAVLLGIVSGYLLGRVEAASRVYALKTLQAFLILAFTVQVGTSFEMVASVFVTSTFQLLFAVTVASYLLIDRRTVVTGEPAAIGSHDIEAPQNVPSDEPTYPDPPPPRSR